VAQRHKVREAEPTKKEKKERGELLLAKELEGIGSFWLISVIFNQVSNV